MQEGETNNDLLARLPFLADALLPLLDTAAVLALASTCADWRRAVQGSLTAARPKSELALPFLAGCVHLKSLQLSHTLPAAAGHAQLFSRISALRSLTHLSAHLSTTAAWRGQALQLGREHLWFLVHLTCLQVLDLSHQPCLAQPGALAPLRQLRGCLTRLALSITGTGWRPCSSAWAMLAELASLVVLDLSGWSSCSAQPEGAAQAQGAAAAGAGAGAPGPAADPAPLQLLGRLSLLQQLVMTDWDEPPSSAGVAALQQLPSLTALDISRCMQGCRQDGVSAAAAPVSQAASLLAVLRGTTHRQRQQAEAAPAPPGAAVPAAAAATAAGAAAAAPLQQPGAAPVLWAGLRALSCSGVDMAVGADCWAALPGLASLDVSCCRRLRGEGLSALQQLQELVASDCPQLDYDELRQLLASSRSLRRLDLQRSTVILHGQGATAAQLLQDRYVRPALPCARQQHALPQRQGQPAGHGPGGGGGGSSSRRDVADVTGAEAAALGAAEADAAAATAAASSEPGSELAELLMSECQLALEGVVWDALAAAGGAPAHPSLLLLDLVAAAGGRLRGLRVLQWGRASPALTGAVMGQLVPAAAAGGGGGGGLRALALGGAGLPDDPSHCWQGLAAAAGLQRLDLNDVGFSRQGYAGHCGTNPTAALLGAVARMRLRSLGLAGWRFYFATLKPLAGLGDCLASLDLSHARDVTDSTLWSLTHLTGLTWLSLSGARVASDQVFSLVFSHLPLLRHLDLSAVANFTERSLEPSLVQLQALTSLDIRSTQAFATAAAVQALAQLPSCRRLAVSLGDGGQARAHGPGGGGVSGRAPPLQQRHARAVQLQASSEVCGRSQHLNSTAGGDLQARYAHLALFGRCQSLRQLLLGCSTPALAEYCRSLLPPWVDVR